MYWLLNCLPLVLEVLLRVIGELNILPKNDISNSLNFLLVMFGIPFYLLYVNFTYIKTDKISYSNGFMCMVIVIFIRIGLDVLYKRIKYGALFNDVPTSLYLLIAFFQISIILIGMLMKFFSDRKVK